MNVSLSTERLKVAIVTQIRETMQSRNCNREKSQLTDQDSRILQFFHLKEWSNNIPMWHDPKLQIGARNWTPPPSGFLKLSFDRVTKGNPRVVGAGKVIKDNGGNII
jgi:hypothetical protein